MLMVIMIMVLMMVMMVMMGVLGGLIGGRLTPGQQRLPLRGRGLCDPALLEAEHPLLYHEDQEESEAEDELRHGILDLVIILSFDLRHHICYFLLRFWQQIQQTGRHEHSAGEAGAQTDDQSPPRSGAGIPIVPDLAQQLVGQHPEHEGDHHHRGQGDELLSHEAGAGDLGSRHYHLRGFVLCHLCRLPLKFSDKDEPTVLVCLGCKF